jgi:hypothetical protein
MTRREKDEKPASRRTTSILLGITLIASAVHFADNAFRLDLYPGPVWLTRNDVLLAWLALPLFAWLAYRSASRARLVAYALLGFAGFAHFLVPHHHSMPLRCTFTIFAEATASGVLIACVLSRGSFNDSRP